MPAIPAVVQELIRCDLPVLFLDTCDLLHIVRAIPRGLLKDPTAAIRLRDAIRSTPPSCRLVLSHLIRVEWEVRSPEAVEESRKHLAGIDALSTAFHDTRDVLGHPIAFTRSGYSASGVTEELLALSQHLLNTALEIDRDDESFLRAANRTYSKMPPCTEWKRVQ